jgi:hypothetical protein
MTASLSVASDVRELTLNEIDDVAGAARIQIGSFYVAWNEGDMRFTMGVGGLNVTVFNDGDICGRAGGLGGGCI